MRMCVAHAHTQLGKIFLRNFINQKIKKIKH
jgi:hypothetical protein